jgi:hypothetical protein
LSKARLAEPLTIAATLAAGMPVMRTALEA